MSQDKPRKSRKPEWLRHQEMLVAFARETEGITCALCHFNSGRDFRGILDAAIHLYEKHPELKLQNIWEAKAAVESALGKTEKRLTA